ncbi:MAG: hypothetical protein ACLT8E_12555 [Akkermansia sp.]
MELVACGPAAVPLERACREWNHAPGPSIRAVMETPIPLTVMGKLDRRQSRPLEEYQKGGLVRRILPGLFFK